MLCPRLKYSLVYVRNVGTCVVENTESMTGFFQSQNSLFFLSITYTYRIWPNFAYLDLNFLLDNQASLVWSNILIHTILPACIADVRCITSYSKCNVIYREIFYRKIYIFLKHLCAWSSRTATCYNYINK